MTLPKPRAPWGPGWAPASWPRPDRSIKRISAMVGGRGTAGEAGQSIGSERQRRTRMDGPVDRFEYRAWARRLEFESRAAKQHDWPLCSPWFLTQHPFQKNKARATGRNDHAEQTRI